jgi:hypothetical protein
MQAYRRQIAMIVKNSSRPIHALLMPVAVGMHSMDHSAVIFQAWIGWQAVISQQYVAT